MPEKKKSRIITTGPFKGLLRNHYKVILADPPWAYKAYSEKGMERSADKHYGTMSLDDIKNLPVQDLMAKDCVVFMWITDPFLFEGINVLNRWELKYKTVGFYWVKFNNDLKTPFTGLGHWTRANCEQCLLASKGKPSRKETGKGVKKLIASVRREHSRKPDEIFERIESLVEGPYLELFAREPRENWSSWGNETTKFKKETFEEDDLIG